MTLSRFPKPLLAWAITLLALGAVAAPSGRSHRTTRPCGQGRADAGYLESGDCRKCHETNYTSWHATFHRTMTQEAGPQSVLGDFERENTLTYQGVRSEMVRENGAYWMKFTGVDGKTQQLEIVRTVGSRRIQQYLTKTGDTWFRAAHCLRSGAAPLDASQWIVLLSRWNRLQTARRGMECELRLLPQREGSTAASIGMTDRGRRRWPNWGLPVAPVTDRRASMRSALFLPSRGYRWQLKDQIAPRPVGR